MLTYFAIGIAVRPLLPSGYFLWLTKKSALFINDDVDPFRIRELPKDLDTMDTAFDVTAIFTSKQTLWLASNDKKFYFIYTTCNYFIIAKTSKWFLRVFTVYIYRDTHKPWWLFMLSNFISDVSTYLLKFLLHLYWKIGILLWK